MRVGSGFGAGSAREALEGARPRLSLLLLLCGVCAAGAQALAQELPARWSGSVTRVSDGDTLWVRPDRPGAAPLKLRLLGLDAPERCQDGGRQARDALASQVTGRGVEVEAAGLDGWGRVLGRVFVGGERPGGGPADVGAWLVARGHAWNDRYRGGEGAYAAQEREARAAGRGLFADPAAVPPWRFRRQHGPCE